MTFLQNTEEEQQETRAESRRMASSAGIAAAILVVSVALFWLIAHQSSPIEGTVTQLWIHPMHTVVTRHDASGVVQAPEAFDQVLVLAQIHLHNRSHQAVILKHLLTNIHLPGGEDSSYAATATDYDRVFVAYPELDGLRTQPLRDDTVIAPMASLDGMIISSFHLTADQWKQQSGMNFEIDLKMHPALILAPKVAATVL